jgi:hypothetical protein
MTTLEIAQTLLIMGGMVAFGLLADKWLIYHTSTIAARLEQERLRDRVFRDALDTIHHLRNENDQLTLLVMAMQNEGDD